MGSWDTVLSLKATGTLSKLQLATSHNDSGPYDDSLAAEVQKQSAALCAFKVDKNDARTNVENLTFLFEYTQAILEIRSKQVLMFFQTVVIPGMTHVGSDAHLHV